MKGNINLLIMCGKFIVVRALPLLIDSVITPVYEVCTTVVSILQERELRGREVK